MDRSHATRLAEAAGRGDLEAAVSITRDHWFDLALSLRSGVIEALEQVPPASLREHPPLLMLLGMGYNLSPQRRARGMRYFASAIFAVRSSRQTANPVDRVLVLTAESAAFRLIGRPALAVRPARAAIAALERMDAAALARVSARAQIYAHLGISLYYGGRTGDALYAFQRGLAESPTPTHASGFANPSMLCGIHALDGDLGEAGAYAAIAREDRWTDVQRSWYPGTFYRVGEAMLALERFDAPAARAHLDAMVHDRRTIEHWQAVASTEALVALVEGRAAAGLAGLDAFITLRGPEGRRAGARSQLAAVRSLLHLAMGNADAAERALQRFEGPSAVKYVASARIALSRGRIGSALHDARVASERADTSRVSVEAATVEAACTLRIPGARRRRAAVEHLGEQLLATGLRLPVALLPPADCDSVRTALSDAGYTAIAEELPTCSLLGFDTPAAQLTDREIAVLRVMATVPSIAGIADHLRLSVHTVKSHRRSIYRKLDAQDRETAIAIALDRGLISASER
ncbi:LuxR C-terminal-related transcriptional regulator [Microbacterium sp. Mu-80]|uniref:LuxR C-terminal-related transcriptional regulator n=1 Tax=Microbacterium bandirmense TaxID=3122050 RepID=A0ABU8LD16_9MICO